MKYVIEIKGYNGGWINVANLSSERAVHNALQNKKWLLEIEKSFHPDNLAWPTEFRGRSKR